MPIYKDYNDPAVYYPTCDSCQHNLHHTASIFDIGGDYDLCKNPKVTRQDLVTGEINYPACRELRHPGGYFGLNCRGYLKKQPEDDEWDCKTFFRNIFGN